jgi:hypothetical protein
MANDSSIAGLSKLKVIDLRAQLAERGLPTTGKKEELIERLAEALKNEEKINQKSPSSTSLSLPPPPPPPSNSSRSPLLTKNNNLIETESSKEAVVINLKSIVSEDSTSEGTPASISSLERLLQRQKRFGETPPNSLLLRTQEQQRLQERMRKFST